MDTPGNYESTCSHYESVATYAKSDYVSLKSSGF